MSGMLALAVRRLTLVAASSGVAFGSVRAGAWSDGKDSRELLSQLKKSTEESIQTLRHGSSPTTKASVCIMRIQVSYSVLSVGVSLRLRACVCNHGIERFSVCVCVCVCERERERDCVCVCVYV